MGPNTGSLAHIPYQPPFFTTREAAILTAQIPTDVLAAAAAGADVRTQQVAEFTTVVGSETHAAAIAAGATEEEAAHAVQAAARASLAAAKAAIAEADATTSTT
jgi:hypothetical protein